MSGAFWWLALAGTGLLLAAAGVLVFINWSGEFRLQVLAAGVVGTLTFLLTFVSTLKPSSLESSFTTFVVEDTRNHLPVFANPDADVSPASLWVSELASVSRGSFAAESGQPPNAAPPRIEPADVSAFFLDLLQYMVVDTIRHRQRVESSVTQLRRPGGGLTRSRINAPAKLSSPVELKAPEAFATLTGNRFAFSPMARFEWEHIGLLLPYRATLRLRTQPGGEGHGRESRTVLIERADYFTLVVSIVPMGSGTPGFVPERVTLPAEIVPHCRSHHFAVRAQAEFPRLTAGNWRTEEHKTWVQWVMNELENRLGVPQ